MLRQWKAGIMLRRDRPLPIWLGHRVATASTPEDYSALVYDKGAWVFHMLRILLLDLKSMNEDRFTRVMQQYYRDFRGGAGSTADFQHTVEQVVGQDMDWFFDQWVYGIGHPVFEVTRTYDAARGRLTLRVRQAQAVDTASSFPRARWFRGWVEVEVDDRVERVWLAPREVNLLTFTAATEPRLVQFDVEGAWLKELTFRKPLEELLYQVAHDRDVLGRRWAMGELSALVRSDATSPPDRARIVEALWRVGLGTGYWRERAAAIGRLQALLDTPENAAGADPA